MSDPAITVTEIIETAVKELGFELVRVTYGGGRKPTLQIMAEREDGTMSVDDCAKLSREVSAILDVEDPLDGEYLLEVSSPGIDRPLTRPKDFSRWVGFDAKVELLEAVDGRRRFRGKILSADDVITTLEVADLKEIVEISYGEISKAKLILTDELIDAVQNGLVGPGGRSDI
ncbi:ribosome maturation factor RimP [Temperatibacter marinus]|uniref:Ribosome maturation factor RimP n=1 Tax=Temperatibacter marinus TaxID=1456591 RepID=A0AA52EAN5_9PROT|nr:ribosome maturation factor RimP [Temperatibacter marinus]WND01351.1 ribosome maturation factor RimP [Temperatibacter marinus]